MSNSKYMFLNGELVQETEAAISPLNRGMMYGDGCFETFRSYSGQFLGWDLHFDRLTAGLRYLEMDRPFTPEKLHRHVHQLLEKNELTNTDAMIRIQCWRKGGRGYKTDSRESCWMMQAHSIKSSDSPIKLTVAGTRCIPSVALERKYKLSNGLNYIKASQEAMSAQCDDSLMLTTGDLVSETTTANVFWIKEDAVFTPSAKCDLLPGITRKILIEILGDLTLEFHEGWYGLDHIMDAETVFCTNSLIEVKEVQAIDDRTYKPDHPVYLTIKKAFQQYRLNELTA